MTNILPGALAAMLNAFAAEVPRVVDDYGPDRAHEALKARVDELVGACTNPWDYAEVIAGIEMIYAANGVMPRCREG